MQRSSPCRRSTAVLAVLLFASILLGGCSASRPTASASVVKPPSADVGTRLDGAVPARLLSMPLRDSTGRAVRLSEFKGKVLVISDSMTLCQETCPIDTATLVQTARDVDRTPIGRSVEFLTITVDPGRDNPPHLAAYRSMYGPAPANWQTLTGSPADIAALWKFLGVYIKRVPDSPPAPRDWLTGKPLTYDIEHSDEVFFFDAASHERFVLEGAPQSGGRSSIPARLYDFMDAGGHHNVAHSDPMQWTTPQAVGVITWLNQLDRSRSSS